MKIWYVVQRLVAALLLPVAAVLILLFAIAIRRGSQGRPVFRQLREGLGGRPFPMFKLRTMHMDADYRLERFIRDAGSAEWERYGRLSHDPRVAGRTALLARRFSIDELPQLVNVVRGEMALVGPRPLPPEIAARLRLEDLCARRQVLPGLTGAWQISGRSELDLTEMGRIDREYVMNRGLKRDLMILMKTPLAVVGARGAY